jgi:hypothetical protein
MQMNSLKRAKGKLVRYLIAGLALVLMTAAVEAQMTPQQTQINGNSRIGQSASKALDANDKDKPKANDKAYNAALKNLPDKQYDPWRGVR